MDNPQSLPQLKLPSVPDDFNGGIGADFARAFMKLLEGAQVAGGALDNGTPFDVGQLQQNLEGLTAKFDGSLRKMRQVVMDGVNDGEIVVPFPDIGTVNYDVNPIVVIPTGANPGTIQVFLIAGSRQTAQFKVRIDGNGGAYQVQFTIIEMKNPSV